MLEQGERRLRADAQQNRDRIIAAARDAFVELGAGAPLEEVSRRAGTGIATLYRRFPDRHALMRAVVVDALKRTAEEARLATEEEPDAFAALTRYMHRALDLRVAAVIPALLEEISMNQEDMRAVQEPGLAIVQKLIEVAKREGTLRKDIQFGDIGTLVVRLSRPLPGPFTREMNDQLAHRHLDLLINGLRAAPDAVAEIQGPAMTLDDLRSVGSSSPRHGSAGDVPAGQRHHR